MAGFTSAQLLDLTGNAFNGFVCIAVFGALLGTAPSDMLLGDLHMQPQDLKDLESVEDSAAAEEFGSDSDL